MAKVENIVDKFQGTRQRFAMVQTAELIFPYPRNKKSGNPARAGIESCGNKELWRGYGTV
jgi:hypothetical protein